MIAINLFGKKEYWKDIFWPHVPVFLKAPVPLMPVIEFFGVFTKPFALMVRLFANMMAGHAIILSFTCVIFLGWSMGVGYGIGLNTTRNAKNIQKRSPISGVNIDGNVSKFICYNLHDDLFLLDKEGASYDGLH